MAFHRPYALIHVHLRGCAPDIACPWCFKAASSEAFIIPSARRSSVVSLQLPSLRIFNLLTRCICWVTEWSVPPIRSFQEISSFSKSGRRGNKATGREQENIQICICNVWSVVHRTQCLLHCKRRGRGGHADFSKAWVPRPCNWRDCDSPYFLEHFLFLPNICTLKCGIFLRFHRNSPLWQK